MPDTHHPNSNTQEAVATVAAEVARTDQKASLLLAFDGAVLAGLASAADPQLPLAAKAFGAAAGLALGVAAILLLLVVRPCLRGGDRSSFPYWAQLEEDELAASLARDTRLARVQALSAIAMTKFARLRSAVDCTLTALPLLALAALCTLR